MDATFPARIEIRSFAVVFLNVSLPFVKRKMDFFSLLIIHLYSDATLLGRSNLESRRL